MYESFFGLKRRPFAATPDPQCFRASAKIQGAFDEVVVCIEQGQGIAVVSAPAGTGKTLLCERLRLELRDRFETIFLRHASFLTRRALLQTILCELNHSYRQQDEQELRLELLPAIHALRPQREALVLICDEAHQLSVDLLEELRILSDLADQGRPLVRLVLVGQPSLEETLASSQMEALNQRIRAQVCLETLDRNESLDYVDYRITWSGGRTEEVFSTDSLDVISRASDGVPRALNQLCDHALLLAYVAEQKPVLASTVREALQDLRQLPLHWNESSIPETQYSRASSSVEFGSDFSDLAEPDSTSLADARSESDVSESLERIIESFTDESPSTSDVVEVSEVSEPHAVEWTPRQPETSTASIEPIDDESMPSDSTPTGHEHEHEVSEFASILRKDAKLSIAQPTAEQESITQPSIETKSEASSMPERARNGFIEEVVFDRYAVIDAGLDPAKQMEAAGVSQHDSLVEADDITEESTNVEMNPSTSNDLANEDIVHADHVDQQAAESNECDLTQADFAAACNRLHERLPQVEELYCWDTESVRISLEGESRESVQCNETSNETPRCQETEPFSQQVAAVVRSEQPAHVAAVEEFVTEEQLGRDVCELVDEVRESLSRSSYHRSHQILDERDSSALEELRAQLDPLRSTRRDNERQTRPETERHSSATIEYGGGTPHFESTVMECEGQTSVQEPEQAAFIETSGASAQSSPEEARPYRYLFSLLRRKQKGLT